MVDRSMTHTSSENTHNGTSLSPGMASYGDISPGSSAPLASPASAPLYSPAPSSDVINSPSSSVYSHSFLSHDVPLPIPSPALGNSATPVLTLHRKQSSGVEHPMDGHRQPHAQTPVMASYNSNRITTATYLSAHSLHQETSDSVDVQPKFALTSFVSETPQMEQTMASACSSKSKVSSRVDTTSSNVTSNTRSSRRSTRHPQIENASGTPKHTRSSSGRSSSSSSQHQRKSSNPSEIPNAKKLLASPQVQALVEQHTSKAQAILAQTQKTKSEQKGRGKGIHRHPFHDNLIEKRRTIKASKFNKGHLAMIVPCYNEKRDVQHTISSLRDELEYLFCEGEVKKYQVYFIVDGSGVDQLITAQLSVEELIERFDTHDRMKYDLVDGNLQTAYDELEELLTLEKQIQELKSARDQLMNNALQQEQLDNDIKAFQQHKSKIFADSTAVNGHRYEDYSTRLIQYDFMYECTQKLNIQSPKPGEVLETPKPKRKLYPTIQFHVTMLIKEQNRQKRDSLLLCVHCCLNSETVPWALGFVDCDTNWNKGSVNRMRRFLGKHDDTAAVSGNIVLRNERWINPLTTLQDFSYLISQIATKEAEHYFGMVTCCPGAFSMMKLEPATDPDSVLAQISKHAVTVEEKNRIELGEDRFWTTLLLERAFDQGYDVKTNSRVQYLRSAVASTDAPEDLITYLLQQRRWINSTNANFAFGLIPKLSRYLCSCNRRMLGISYLWLRSFFEQITFLLAPGLIALLMVAMLDDVGLGAYTEAIVTATVLIIPSLIVLLFPKPREYPLPYKAYVAISSVLMGVLTASWFSQIFPTIFSDIFDVSSAIRKAVLLGYFVLSFGLSVVHGKVGRCSSPIYKPFLSLAFIPLQYVLLPTFCYLNIADFSWGNRDTVGVTTAAETVKSQKVAKMVFTWFLLFNWGAFALHYLDGSITTPVYSAFMVLLLVTMIGTMVFSTCSAYHNFMHTLKKRFRKTKSKKLEKEKEKILTKINNTNVVVQEASQHPLAQFHGAEETVSTEPGRTFSVSHTPMHDGERTHSSQRTSPTLSASGPEDHV
eukprot:GILJ01010445.1.p1 GENE.GILJ01010445.1~~GILJ01010445.1.p1  ORF type:complete len:1054 (-),score=169.42 GILJ01010445.1:363-3524(-)